MMGEGRVKYVMRFCLVQLRAKTVQKLQQDYTNEPELTKTPEMQAKIPEIHVILVKKTGEKTGCQNKYRREE